jgi:hypothetical protein
MASASNSQQPTETHNTSTTPSTAQSPLHDALDDILGESQGNREKDLKEIKSKYAHLLT